MWWRLPWGKHDQVQYVPLESIWVICVFLEKGAVSYSLAGFCKKLTSLAQLIICQTFFKHTYINSFNPHQNLLGVLLSSSLFYR